MLDEILNPPPEGEKVETQPVENPQPDTQQDGGEPTAPQNDPPHVPLAALESERKQRQDWKEKAIRFEEELKHLREQGSNPPQPALDPLQTLQQQLINERFNTSEMLVKQAHADADDVVGVFMETARGNPALVAAMQQQRHPWDFAYKEGKRLLMLKEVGDDPAAYRAKVEAEVRASLQSNQAPLNLPVSLNGARSVAPRGAPSFTGPAPFEAIVNRR